MTMIIGLLLKTTRKIKTHIRNHKPVRAYVQQGKTAIKRAGNIFEQHYKDISKWASSSVFHQIGKGTHFMSVDDAILAGQEAAFEALRRYSPAKGTLVGYVRPQIKFGILKHLAWERSHGQTGIRTLYDLMHAAATDEERGKILERFPEVLEVTETEPAPDIEAVFEGAQALLKRDELLDQIEAEFNVDLRSVSTKLKKREAEKGTWKKTSLAKRKVKAYRMLKLENLSFRDTAAKLGIDVKEVYKDFSEVSELIKQVRHRKVEELIKHEIKKSLPKREMLEARFLLNLERLERAKANSYPHSFIDFTEDVLAGILAQLT